MNVLRQSLLQLRRDWRAGELYTLMFALLVAVASVSSVGLFVDRIEQAFALQSAELLAGDLALVSDQPPGEDIGLRARQSGLQMSRSVVFPSMVVAGDARMLVSVKAVDSTYPLRGQLKISQQAYGAEQVSFRGPVRGEIWLEPRVATQLGVTSGQHVSLGYLSLRVSAILRYEPDRGGGMFNMAPRVMMHSDDLAATGLIQEGSRLQYRWLFAGERAAVSALRDRLAENLQRGQRLETPQQANDQIRSALDRARHFLGLAAMVAVILATIAVAMAARRFSQRHLVNCAMMRCLGAQQKRIAGLYLWQMVWLALLASLLGSLIGYAMQMMLTGVVGQMLHVQLPEPSLNPLGFAMITGLVSLLGFALPPVLRLPGVPTISVLRRESLGKIQVSALGYLPGVLAMAGLVLWQGGDLRLGGGVLLGLLLTAVTLSVFVYGMILLLRRVQGWGGVSWRYGLSAITRRAGLSVVQVLSLGLGLMVLLVLTLVRTDLLQQWQASLPVDAPNRFLINIQPGQLPELKAFFAQHGLRGVELEPMIRGRLLAINERTVSADDYSDDRARRLVEREFNLSWMAKAPQHNTLTSGQWWVDPQAKEFSVEKGIAETLGIELGDSMRYDIAGETVEARVTSLREVQWDSFRVNFFVIASPALLQEFPASYITAFYLADERHQVLADLAQRFANVTIIDVSVIMNQVRSVIRRVIMAVQGIFIFTLLAGVVILFTALQSTRDERLNEGAIMRTLGASRKQILQGLAVEFLVLGALAGFIATAGAVATASVIGQRLFDLDYHSEPAFWLLAIAGSALAVGVAGLMGTYNVVRQAPLKVLRRV